jgi:hypothetical protein
VVGVVVGFRRVRGEIEREGVGGMNMNGSIVRWLKARRGGGEVGLEVEAWDC